MDLVAVADILAVAVQAAIGDFMKKSFLSFCLLVLLNFSFFAQEITFSNPGTAPKNLGRPSVALVLSGGGINGAAHVPILEELEKLGIPVDIVIGTSIGAIVGGLYCIGYTPEKLHELFVTQDWTPIFSDFSPSPYEQLYEEHGIKQNLLPIKVGTDGYLQVGKAVLNGQKAYEMLKTLSAKIPSNINFDDLDIPFRCVATDMVTGEPYLFSKGDLAEAIRASMNVAGLFEPLKIDDKYFLDGGLSYNLPINIAKQMGYDIIIAVEISPSSQKSIRVYETTPIYTLIDSIYTPMKTVDNLLVPLADLVLFPDMSKYELTDFYKAEEIYQEGVKEVQNHKEDFIKIRDRIFPNGNNPKKSEDLYSKKDYLIPQNIKVENAYSEDEKYILKKFEKIKNHELTSENLSFFMNEIYKTGHYKIVQTRISKTQNGDALDLILTKKPKPSLMLLVGLDYKLSANKNDFTSILNANAAFQLRGFTTADSLLSIRGTFLNDWEANLLYFQPITKLLYLSFQSSYNYDFFENYEKYISQKNKITFGFNYFNNITFYNGFFFDINKIPTSYDDSKTTFAAGIFNHFGITTLNQPCFSEKGFLFDINFKWILPNQNSSLDFANSSFLTYAKLKTAIPLGKYFSLNFSIFGGYDFARNLENSTELNILYGFNNYDRIYFPQYCLKTQFSQNKLATSLSLQFSPFEHITIAGGKLYFILNGTWGTLEKFSDGVWSTSLGAGLRVVDSFNVLLRTGIASISQSKITPFFTIDLGALQF